MPRPTVYLVNPAAGGGRGQGRWRRLEPRLRGSTTAAEVLVSSHPGDLAAMAQRIAGDCELLVAVGGDGTVSEVLQGLERHPAPRAALAILPLGSGNDIARMAGIRDTADAIQAIHGDQIRRFDSIRVECQGEAGPVHMTALGFAGAGLAAAIISHAPTRLKRLLGGRLGYTLGFFLALARYHPYPARIRAGAWSSEEPLAALVVANHTHAGGHTMHIGPGARPDDGALDISVIRGLGRLAVGSQFVRLLRGSHVHHPAVRYFRGDHIELDGPRAIPVQADGEVVGTTPAVFRLRPASVRIAVPGDGVQAGGAADSGRGRSTDS